MSTEAVIIPLPSGSAPVVLIVCGVITVLGWIARVVSASQHRQRSQERRAALFDAPPQAPGGNSGAAGWATPVSSPAPLLRADRSASAQQSPSPVPGWASDPHGRYQLRYHDGTQWTASVSSDGIVGTDPIPGTA